MTQERRLSYWSTSGPSSCAVPAPVNGDSDNAGRLKIRTGGTEMATVKWRQYHRSVQYPVLVRRCCCYFE